MFKTGKGVGRQPTKKAERTCLQSSPAPISHCFETYHLTFLLTGAGLFLYFIGSPAGCIFYLISSGSEPRKFFACCLPAPLSTLLRLSEKLVF
jgi:hypothetical protein